MTAFFLHFWYLFKDSLVMQKKANKSFFLNKRQKITPQVSYET